MMAFGLLLTTITATETGSQWFINWLIKTNDIPLTIKSIEGRFLDRLTLSELHYNDGDVNDVRLARLELDWSATDLLQFEANVKKLALTDLVVRTKPETNTDETFSIPGLEYQDLPFGVYVDEFSLNKAHVISGDTEINVQTFQSSITLNSDQIYFYLDKLTVNEQGFDGTVLLTENVSPKIDLKLNWSGTINNEAGNGTLAISGVQNDLIIDANIDSVVQMLLQGRLDLNPKSAQGELAGEIKGKLFDSFSEAVVLDTPINFHLKGNMQQLTMQLGADAHTASGESFSLSLNTEAVLPGSTTESLNVNVNWASRAEQTDNPLLMLKGQGDLSLLDQVLTIDHDLYMPDLINVSGKFDLSNQALDLAIDWDAIALSLSNTDKLKLKTGFIKAEGKLNELSVLLQTQYLLDSKKEITTDSSESAYASLSATGDLNLLTAHPVGLITGNLKTPVPLVLVDKIKSIGLINFTLKSDSELINLNVDSNIRTNKDEDFVLGFKSKLELTASTSAKPILFNWFLTPENETNLKNSITGQGRIEYKPEQISFNHQSNAPYLSTLKGNARFDDDTMLELDLDWQDIDLAFVTHQALASERGKIHLEGPLTSLTINADALFDVAPVGAIELDLNALWSESVLTVNTLDIGLLDGKLDLKGVVNLVEGTKGNFKLDASNLNFGKINPDLASRLMISSTVDFADAKEGISAKLNLNSISGQWRSFPVEGLGELAYAKNSIRVDNLHLESGVNKLDLNLNIDESLQGLIDVSIQDLSVFSSDFAGNIQGQLDISGKPETPGIEGKLTGNKIYMNDVRLTSFVVDTQIDLRPQQNSSVLLQVNALSYQNRVIDKVLLTLKGLTESHTIELMASGSELELNSSMSSGLKDKVWSAQLKQLDLKYKEFGEWQLSKPSNMVWRINDEAFTLTESCLSQTEAYICVSGSNDLNQALVTDIKLKQLPLKLAKPWLPETMSLNGDISGDISFKKQTQQWQLNTLLEGNETQIELGFEDNTELLNINTALLRLSADQDHREILINVTSPDYFDLVLTGDMSKAAENPLQLDLGIKLKQLDWLEKLEPALSGSHGQFQANINATGTITKPEVKGSFSLQEGQLSILPMGLNLSEVRGDIKSIYATDQIQINSVIGNQTKQLLINGRASMNAEAGYPYAFELTGSDFPIIRTADISIDVSPELQLSGTQELHYIKGNLTVPLLDILITSVPEGAVSVSPDVVVIQSKEVGAVHIDEGNAGNDFVKNNIDIDVDVILKPEMHIQAFGLDTRLLGDLNVVKPAGLYQPRAEGQVTVKQGSYRAYGQNLKIGQGRLQFAGPLDNPALSIRAYRPGLAVKAGVNVTGNARSPKLTLFSEPAQTEADTLSYIITGRPISGASGGEASLIAQAAFSLGSEQSSVLANQIRDLFHLDDFSVGGGDSLDSTSLSASKRLSPNLTFRSSFNPFDQLWSFLLNYELTDNWSVQTESGVTQGADLIYSIESNSFRDLYDRFWDVIKF